MLNKKLKKYIVFQIWGDNPLFLIGLIENIKLSPQIYPQWKVRIYYNNVPKHWLLRIKQFPVELVKEMYNDKIQFQIWRILPLFDKGVDVFICRDADSRINYREKAAVDDWLESDKPLHIMRDHPSGHNTKILAGMCGFNNCIIRKTIKLKDSNLIHQLKLNDRDTDQEFLRKVIFPFFSHNHIAHDKYNHFNYGCERDFPPTDPSKRKICNFVGEVHDYYNNTINWHVKTKLQLLNLDTVRCCEIYGFKIPTELECLKLEISTKCNHDPFTSYYPRLLDKKFNTVINNNKKMIETLRLDNQTHLENIRELSNTLTQKDENHKNMLEALRLDNQTYLANIRELSSTLTQKDTSSKMDIQALRLEIEKLRNIQSNIKIFLWTSLISGIVGSCIVGSCIMVSGIYYTV